MSFAILFAISMFLLSLLPYRSSKAKKTRLHSNKVTVALLFCALNLQAQNVIRPPSGTLRIDEVLVGNVTATSTASDIIAFNRVSGNVYSLGSVTNGGTATLNTNYSSYSVTATGATWTLSVPTNMITGNVLIDGVSTSDLEPQVITLSNSAIRPAQSASVATNKFTIPASSSSKFTILLRIAGGIIERFAVDGDDFTPPTPATVVTFTPTSEISATDAQAAFAELGAEKLARADVSAVATNGAYASLSGVPTAMSQAEAEAGLSATPRLLASLQLAQAIAAQSSDVSGITSYSSGTAYTLTSTSAALDFGTGDPVMTITAPGYYAIFARSVVRYNDATFSGNQTNTLMLRRTNNTATNLTETVTSLTTAAVTNYTANFAVVFFPVALYSTTNSNDSITIFGDISTVPSAGSLDVTQASIIALKIGGATTLDTAPPTITSMTIATDGLDVSILASEISTVGAGGNGGFTVTMSGGAATLTYASGAGTTTLHYTSSRVILVGETGTHAYTQPTNGIEDTAGNDLVTYSGATVTNNSTQTAGESLKQTIGSDPSFLNGFTASTTMYLSVQVTNVNAYHLTRTEWKLQKAGSPTGTISSRLYATSGGIPTTLLQTSSTTLNATSLTGTYTIYSFDFSYDLSAGVTYAVSLDKSVIDASNFVRISAVTTGVHGRSSDGTTWFNVTTPPLTQYLLLYGY